MSIVYITKTKAIREAVEAGTDYVVANIGKFQRRCSVFCKGARQTRTTLLVSGDLADISYSTVRDNYRYAYSE